MVHHQVIFVGIWIIVGTPDHYSLLGMNSWSKQMLALKKLIICFEYVLNILA